MKHTIMYLVATLLLMLPTLHAARAQTTTLANTPGNWYAYDSTGAPPVGWQTDGDTAKSAGWELARVGNPNSDQRGFLDTAYFGTLTSVNYVWSDEERDTAYLKYVFDIEPEDCRRWIIEYAVDDSVAIQINGQTPTIITETNPPNPYNQGWRILYTVDITGFLRCGQNVITAIARNVASQHKFLVARVRTTGNAPRDLKVTATEVDCRDPLRSFTLRAAAGIGAEYRWTGPNGFESNLDTVTVNASGTGTGNPKSIEGWYVCTVTRGCCTFVDSVLVRVPLSCCEVGLNVERFSCNDYKVSVDDAFAELMAFYWKVDGRIITDTNRVFTDTSKFRMLNLSEGTHHICIHYLGRSKKYPDEVCCEEVCVTITVPTVERATETRTYCDFDTYTGLEPSKEFDASRYSYYILRKTTPPFHFYDSRTGQYGQTWHAVDAGSWTVDYYDEEGCLRKQLIVNVIVTPSDTTYCSVTLTNPCAGELDPKLIEPLPDGSCADCYAVSVADPNAEVQHVASKFDGAKHIGEVYQKHYRDYKNCKVCIFTYEILHSECHINVDFDILPTSTPFTFKLVNRSTGNGQLVGHTWQVDGYFNHTYLPGEPETQQMDFAFNGPGEYRICLNLCNYYCEKECCGKKCLVIRIDSEGRLTIVDRYSPPQVQGSEHGNHAPAQTSATPNAITIVPNPTSYLFRLQQSGVENGMYERVEIMDHAGKVLLTMVNVSSDYEYNLTGYARGSYAVRVKTGSSYQHLKLVLR